MNVRLAAVCGVLALGAACGGDVPPYPELTGITRVDVRARLNGRDTAAASITDPDSVGRIVAFVNARRGGWERPWDGIPVPAVVAEFYRGAEFMGHVGSGPTFLETQRDGDFASRPSSVGEVAAFNALLGIPTRVIAVPARP